MKSMKRFGRRDFLQRSAAFLPLAAVPARAAGSHHLKNIGAELYTVRSIITKNPAATLSAIQDIGYTEVEVVYASIHEIWDALQQTKLKPVSVHVDSKLFADSGQMQQTLEQVHKWGFQYAVYPYLPESERGGADAIKRLADTLNKAGEQGKKLGLRLCYHNHAFEFEPINGVTGLEILLKNTDRNLVSLELDVFWASVAGHNPVQLIQQHPDRIALVHLKDKPKDFPVQFNEKVPKEAFKEVGKGSVDFPGVLKAATAAGVVHFFVEQDQTPGDPVDSLRISYQYLHNLSF